MSYEVEIIERKYLTVQLEASKLSIKDLFSDYLNEKKSFKYQITVKVLLKKYKLNKEIEFTPVYFNSVTKTVINHRVRLIMDLAGMLNKLSLNTLTFQLIDHLKKVLIWTHLLN